MHVSELGREREIPEYGELMTLQDFGDCVKSGTLIDYDGFGEWSDGKSVWGTIFEPETIVLPSKFFKDHVPEGATHVVWFNK